MAQASLKPWKFILDMGSSSLCGLIIVPCQEANGDDLGMPFRSSIKYGFNPAGSATFFLGDLTMKYVLRSFSLFH